MIIIPLGDDINNRMIPVVGTILLLANIIVFAYEVRLDIDAHEKHNPEIVRVFFREYGLIPTDVEQGYYGGIFTYMFVHGDIFHLLGNMLVFWAFIRTLENSLGGFSFLFLYFFWGVVAGLAHVYMHWGETRPLVGASGAISGMMGGYFVSFGFRTSIKTLLWFFYPMRVDIPAPLYLGFNLAMQFVGVAEKNEGIDSGVAWFCHLGGFAAGGITMFLCKGQTQRRLIRNREGELVFVEADAPIEPKVKKNRRGVLIATPAATAPSMPSSFPESCPHCETSVDEQHRISANLLQCPNPDCRRLVFLG